MIISLTFCSGQQPPMPSSILPWQTSNAGCSRDCTEFPPDSAIVSEIVYLRISDVYQQVRALFQESNTMAFQAVISERANLDRFRLSMAWGSWFFLLLLLGSLLLYWYRVRLPPRRTACSSIWRNPSRACRRASQYLTGNINSLPVTSTSRFIRSGLISTRPSADHRKNFQAQHQSPLESRLLTTALIQKVLHNCCCKHRSITCWNLRSTMAAIFNSVNTFTQQNGLIGICALILLI